MKIVKWLCVGVIVLVAVVVVSLIFFGGHVIKQSVNAMGPQVLGVPVKLEQARFYPLRGHVSMSGLTVGNPEGFNTENLFFMKQLEIDLQMRSLFTDTIVIERILIDAPQITYEMGLGRNNIGALLAGLEGDETGEEAKPDETGEAAPGKQVVIKELILADARAQVSATAMRGQVVPVQLSTITLNDLGGEDQSLTQITTQVLKAILGAVVNAVAGAGELLGDGLKAAFDGVGALGGMATDGAQAVVGVAGEGVKAVTGVAGEGVQAVTGVAGDGARAVTGVIGGGVRGVRGLLGGEGEGKKVEEKEEEEEETEGDSEPADDEPAAEESPAEQVE